MESVLLKLLLGAGTRLLAVVVVMCVMVVLVRAAWVGLPNAGRGE